MRLKATDLAGTCHVASAQVRTRARFRATHPRLYQLAKRDFFLIFDFMIIFINLYLGILFYFELNVNKERLYFFLFTLDICIYISGF